MRNSICVFMVAVLLAPAASVQADVLFSDSFDRADSTDVDASSGGMNGPLTPMVYRESFEGSGAASSIQILSNRLNVAVGAGMSSLYLDHNFVDGDILAADGFAVSLNVASITAASDEANRFGGFGVGLTRDEAAAAQDSFDSDAPLRGVVGQAPKGVADLYVDLALDQQLRVWSNGAVLQTIDVQAASGTIELQFFARDFNAGSPVAAVIYFDGVQRAVQAFQWDHANANYIGISGRTVGAGVFLDNLSIGTVAQQAAGIDVSATGGRTAVKEGGYTDEIILSMASDPLAYPVTIDIADGLDPDQVTVSPSQVIFTSANWQEPQTVIVTAIDDNDMERAIHETSLTFRVTADAGSAYHDYLVADAAVEIEENDCGAWGFNPADFNLDCQVNMADFAIFALEWIECSMPEPGCGDYRP